jgi:3-phenylpropionate/trans-cinnamate dioxygenase ferredoxin subunit
MSEDWIALARADELAVDQMKPVELGGKRMLLVRTASRFYLIDEMCSHEDYSLYLGCIQECRIKCSLHGSYFDLASGDALDDPADEPIATYPVRESEGQIWGKASA